MHAKRLTGNATPINFRRAPADSFNQAEILERLELAIFA
jgi:hypothetical protein